MFPYVLGSLLLVNNNNKKRHSVGRSYLFMWFEVKTCFPFRNSFSFCELKKEKFYKVFSLFFLFPFFYEY